MAWLSLRQFQGFGRVSPLPGKAREPPERPQQKENRDSPANLHDRVQIAAWL